MRKIIYLLIFILIVSLSFELYFINSYNRNIDKNSINKQKEVISSKKYKNMHIESYIEELNANRDVNITRILYKDLSYDIFIDYKASFSEILSLFEYIKNNKNCNIGSYGIMLEEDNYYKLTVELSFTKKMIID